MQENAVVFPGQGCQRPGMGRDVHQLEPTAKAAFDEASDALSIDVAALCFGPAGGDEAAACGDAERLALTEFAQPAILTAEIALLRFLQSRGFEFGPVGGHSLGEYSALVAAGVIPLAEAASLVRARGRLMQEAVPVGEGGMTALVGRNLDAAAVGRCAQDADVDIANHNSADQIVLSGRLEELQAACEAVRALPGHERVRAMPLRVSAPFHSRHMRPVADSLRSLLEASVPTWDVSEAPRVLSNADGGFHNGSAESLVDALCRQVAAPVRWLDNMRALSGAASAIVEVGPSAPLGAFFKREGVSTSAVTTAEAAEDAAALASPT